MNTFLCSLRRHHNTGGSFDQLFDVEDKKDALLYGLYYVVECENGVDLTERNRQAIVLALVDALQLQLPKPDCSCSDSVALKLYDSEDDDSFELFALWKTDTCDVAIGPSSDGTASTTNKYNNFWITVTPWEPNKHDQKRLMKLSKEELVDMILRLHVTEGYVYEPNF